MTDAAGPTTPIDAARERLDRAIADYVESLERLIALGRFFVSESDESDVRRHPGIGNNLWFRVCLTFNEVEFARARYLRVTREGAGHGGPTTLNAVALYETNLAPLWVRWGVRWLAHEGSGGKWPGHAYGAIAHHPDKHSFRPKELELLRMTLDLIRCDVAGPDRKLANPIGAIDRMEGDAASAREERDHFIYQQIAVDRRPARAVLQDVNGMPTWPKLSKPQSVLKAARSYAHRNKLPPLPRPRKGRPPKQPPLKE